MRIIYCNLDPFTYDQEVYLYDESSYQKLGKAPIENLDVFVASQCKEHNINDVTLTGLDHYAVAVADKIQKYASTKYDNFNINVTVR